MDHGAFNTSPRVAQFSIQVEPELNFWQDYMFSNSETVPLKLSLRKEQVFYFQCP